MPDVCMKLSLRLAEKKIKKSLNRHAGLPQQKATGCKTHSASADTPSSQAVRAHSSILAKLGLRSPGRKQNEQEDTWVPAERQGSGLLCCPRAIHLSRLSVLEPARGYFHSHADKCKQLPFPLA